MNTEKIILLYERFVTSGKWTVNENGRVYSNTSKRYLECVSDQGYYIVSTREPKTRKPLKVKLHHIVYYHFNGSLHSELVINHKDGNKLNNHPDNLELVTNVENIKHAFETGLNPHDEFCEAGAKAVRKLTEEDVRFIRSSPKSLVELAMQFSMAKSTLSYVRNRKTYSWVI